MRNVLRRTTISALALSLALVTACTDQGNKNKVSTRSNQMPSPLAAASPNTGGITASSEGNVTQLATGADGSLPIRSSNGEDYVQATKLLEQIGYKTKWDSAQNVLLFGDNDAAFELKMNSADARKEEDTLKLKAAPVLLDGIPHIPVSALSDLLSEDVQFSKNGQMLNLQPALNPITLDVDQDGAVSGGEALDFGEDAADPYKNANIDTSEPTSGAAADTDDDGAIEAVALKNINIPALITRARKYLGVRYDFGALPYTRSGTFDCSSYTQYLFGKYGISLPRTARAQARMGNTVSRKNLRRGDLLFFYVPGRFKTNRTVGHVGIYIGDYKMIHSSPKPKDGVQITNINKAYWKETYLYSKRFAY